MSKEAYYFSHDANARNDPKILAMKSEFGISGYGVYWTIVEMLREEEDYKLPMKDYIFNAIAMQVQCKSYAKDDAKRFVLFCINECELFDTDDTHFWSNSLMKRMEKRSSISEKRSEAAKKRWNKASDSNDSENDDDANAMQKDANAMQSDARKGKEKKGNKKEIKDIKKEKTEEPKHTYAEYVTMTEKQFNKLIDKHGRQAVDWMIEKLDNHKGAKGTKYKSDYHAILNWVVSAYEKEKGGTKPMSKLQVLDAIGEGLEDEQEGNIRSLENSSSRFSEF